MKLTIIFYNFPFTDDSASNISSDFAHWLRSYKPEFGFRVFFGPPCMIIKMHYFDYLAIIHRNKAKYTRATLICGSLITHVILTPIIVQSCAKVMATFFQVFFKNIYLPPNCIKRSVFKLEVLLNIYF